MTNLIWEKKSQEAVKLQQRFGWSVREMKGAVFVQRNHTDINKKIKNFQLNENLIKS